MISNSKSKSEYKGPVNAEKPILDVLHSELQRYSDSSMYKSKCPVCEEGLLLIGRNQENHKLLEVDYCVLCGQHVRYLDIDRLNDGC